MAWNSAVCWTRQRVPHERNGGAEHGSCASAPRYDLRGTVCIGVVAGIAELVNGDPDEADRGHERKRDHRTAECAPVHLPIRRKAADQRRIRLVSDQPTTNLRILPLRAL